MGDQAVLRISRELAQIQHTADLSIAVDYDESDIRHVRAVILGPPETPYQFGFFEFAIKFGKEYPARPPDVRALTTNGGSCRFSPNLYAGGKVCLSILGTWSGDRGEEWSSAQGLESVLISIQSLMSSNPYENEPGFDNAKSDSDKLNMEQYKSKIRHETIRIAVIQPLEAALGILPGGTEKLPTNRIWEDTDSSEDEAVASSTPFFDLRKRRFLWYYESFMQLVESEARFVQPKSRFQWMPFEHGSNAMDGHFNYPELKRRLALIRDNIFKETEGWKLQGLQAKKDEIGIAVNLQRQFEQIVENLKHHKNYSLDLNIVDENPFLWRLTYFGRPTTPLEGGIIKIRIHLSTQFPKEQPRVFLDAPLAHVRVSPQGVLCYLPKKTEDMRHHIEAIVAALEEEDPPYDPRTTVNPEASKLFWGSPEDRKKYKRTLRRDVERSVEDSLG
ncbi:ubiquitin-conjugating enzyme/RWD-like protein [Aspergillus carlsbadensis]|nr:ubiquitin-conjugating enzyme/RWD-like protein [Aspergillus carlsbadensis]